MTTENSNLVRSVFETALRDLLVESATRPIVGADEAGAFPAAPYGAMITKTTFLVVPDTNYLLRDVANACRFGRRVLVSAANNGFLRLYCPPHVIDEVYEKALETCERQSRERGEITIGEFIDRWEQDYLPLIRCVDDAEGLLAVLTPAERDRIERLRILDADDVPSAVLAVALNAFFLSWDRDALYAVYGRKTQQEELHDQILTLMDGGRIGKVSEMIVLLLLIPVSAFQALGEVLAWVQRRAPWAPWLLAAAAVGIVLSLSEKQRSALGSFTGAVLMVVGELYELYNDAIARLESAGPGDPNWQELFESVGRRRALVRATLHTLARLPEGISSAKLLSRRLPELAIGKGEKLVRHSLRSNGCFVNPYIGNWQVARPVPPRN